LLKEFYEHLSPNDIEYYKNLSDKAIELGYSPKRDKKKGISISFTSLKNKKTILRFTEEMGKCFWRLNFYANENFSEMFDISIKNVIKKIKKYNNVGCNGCGKCKKGKFNYTVKYDDGSDFILCGFVLIKIEKISKKIVKEATRMMIVQHEAFMNELKIK
jgi:hypothetical protein